MKKIFKDIEIGAYYLVNDYSRNIVFECLGVSLNSGYMEFKVILSNDPLFYEGKEQSIHYSSYFGEIMTKIEFKEQNNAN
jgi:hypothetical protein